MRISVYVNSDIWYYHHNNITTKTHKPRRTRALEMWWLCQLTRASTEVFHRASSSSRHRRWTRGPRPDIRQVRSVRLAIGRVLFAMPRILDAGEDRSALHATMLETVSVDISRLGPLGRDFVSEDVSFQPESGFLPQIQYLSPVTYRRSGVMTP